MEQRGRLQDVVAPLPPHQPAGTFPKLARKQRNQFVDQDFAPVGGASGNLPDDSGNIVLRARRPFHAPPFERTVYYFPPSCCPRLCRFLYAFPVPVWRPIRALLVNTTSARRYIREGDRLTRRQFKASAAQFTADWNECLEVIERRLLATHPRTDCLEPAVYHAIVRAELNTWFQPEHHRGAWLRALSNVRPEVAATLRQGLTDIRLPQRSYRLAPPRWAGPLVYAATVA